jgi:hypothetical protein
MDVMNCKLLCDTVSGLVAVGLFATGVLHCLEFQLGLLDHFPWLMLALEQFSFLRSRVSAMEERVFDVLASQS